MSSGQSLSLKKTERKLPILFLKTCESRVKICEIWICPFLMVVFYCCISIIKVNAINVKLKHHIFVAFWCILGLKLLKRNIISVCELQIPPQNLLHSGPKRSKQWSFPEGGGLLPSSCRCIRTPSKPLFYGQKCYVRTFWCYILLYFRAVFDKCREELLMEKDRLSWANYGPKTISISFLPPPYFLPGKMSKIFNFYRCSKSLSGFDICPLCQSVQVIH